MAKQRTKKKEEEHTHTHHPDIDEAEMYRAKKSASTMLTR